MALYRLDLEVAEENFALAEALVGSHMAASGWEEISLPSGNTLLRVHCPQKDVLETMAAQVLGLLPETRLEWSEAKEQDYLEAWKEYFTPIHAGCFLVLPPWRMGEAQKAKFPVLIEPKSAFGTGHHATTALCLKAISDLYAEGKIVAGQSFFDLGTGSGILGIGCALLGMKGEGSDIDPLAVSNAKENIDMNKVGHAFSVTLGSAEAAKGPYDVVVANILAGPLRELAPQVLPLVAPGGILVLSGILTSQAEAVSQAYAALGQCSTNIEGEWAALVWSA